ncbi:unnamed protein product [Meloidogyne enterolobii]|uniref:Uncharacterized protein n=1 Tax=Meloidogyne enterolobii TaxID=390850 RepID=A0ACB1ACA6_MELEN
MLRQSELVKEEFLKAKKLIGEEYLLGYFEKLKEVEKEEEQYVRKEESPMPLRMTESSIIHSKSKQSFSEDLPDSHESFASSTSEAESETSGSAIHSHTNSFSSSTSGSYKRSPVSNVVKHSASLPEINRMPKPVGGIKKSVSTPNFLINSTSFAAQSSVSNPKKKSKSSSIKLRQQEIEEKQKIGKI